MLYTVLGLYEPAELAIDTRLIPTHYGFARLAESSAPSRIPVYVTAPTSSARHPLLTSVCAEDYRLRV